MLSFYMGVLKMQMDRQIDAGAKVRTCFQYPGDKVGLRFEYDRVSVRKRGQDKDKAETKCLAVAVAERACPFRMQV